MNLKTILPSTGSKVWRNSALLLLALVGVPMLSFLPVDSRITGRVFRDFNANGVFDTTPIEVGVAGVTVTAYTPTGSSVTATTGADGTYSLVTVTGTKYRIEFTGLETGDFESAYGSASGNNGTSVQFAASGDVNVNLGVNYPAQYSSTTNPKVITSGFVSGNQSGNSYSTNILWGVSHNATGTPTKIDLGTAQQYGSIWGTAYSKNTKNFYVAAFTKRYVGFGTGGPGAIYVTQTSGDVAAAAPEIFYDFPDSQVGGASSVIHGDLGTNPGSASTDNAGYDNVGKTSLGDIELSEDEKDLYVVNLADRTLNKINIATKLKTQTIAIPSPVTGKYANDYRPFALKVYRGKVYVGVVSTNESSYTSKVYLNTTAYRDDKGDNAGLNAAVFSFDGTTFTKVLDFPLTYKKQASNADQTGTARAEYYRPWTNTYRTDRESPASYPQAWLTNIEFDVNGEMILGVRDRFGDQMGYNNLRPTGTVGPSDAATLSCITPGEILRAGKNTNGWTIESVGSVGGSTASANQLAQVGPGGHGKYYYGDMVDAGANHGSSSAGGLALLAGSGKVIMTAMDPTDDFNTGGLKRLVNSTGANDGGAVLYSASVINWGKANGMGDVELLTAPAPIEIGNRVWIDKDSDGIQDGDEAGLAGVSIQLLASNGTTVIATAVTDANGNYIFSNATGTNTTSLIYGLTALTANTNYSLRILNTSGSSKQTVLTGYNLTGADKDATTNGDTRDSDGIVSTTNATAAVTTGNNGENNHTFDFGFVPYVNLGDKVWIDVNNNGIFDAGELPVPTGTVVKIYAASTTDGVPLTPGTPLATTTTNASGNYLFDNLAPGDYVVSVMNPAGYTSSTIKATDPDNNVDNDNNGVRTVSGETFSNTVTLQPGTEPTGETPNTNTNTSIADNNSNLTVDFGFVAAVNLGNKVWIDANNNGLFDTGELPVPTGTVVKLYVASATDGVPATPATPLATTTTDASGYYLFDNLVPGNYVVSVMNPTGYSSSTINATNPNNNIDNDDNGVRTVSGETFSNTMTLAVGTEPTGETPNTNPAGNIADNSSNLTLDFGFVALVNVGNKVWIDANNNGLFDSGELPVPTGTVVKIYTASSTNGVPATPTTPLATTTTDASGNYLFDNLIPGSYVISVMNPAGYTSSTINATDPNNDVDNDDNGVRTVSGETFSNTVVLAAGSEPTGETPNTNTNTNIADNSSNLTIDFGFVAAVNLGNKVWIDANNNGLFDSGESAVPTGTVVNLYVASTTNGVPATPATPLATTTTDASGYYLFDNLIPGNYVVSVMNPAGYISSTINALDPNNKVDNDDNGVRTVSGETFSNTITLAVGTAPTGETPNTNPAGNIADNSSNLTLDFGFVTAVNVGNKVWIDANNNGIFDATEIAAPVGTVVKIYVASTTDGVPATPATPLATTTTDASGYYLFDNLAPGSYVISVMNPTGFSSSTVNATNPNNDVDNDDNGVRTVSGETFSNTVVLAAGTEPTGETPNTNPAGNIADNSSNLTIDFGFYNPALPVTLTNFDGKAVEKQSVLNWSTTAETNSAYFEVQRSVDGKTWTTVGSVLAQGESADLHKYDFTDGSPVNGENLYRLKMVDADQTFAYSRIISIKQEVGYQLSVFPNPTSDVVKIETSTGASVQKVQVYSLIGKLVKEVVSPKGGEISVQQLPSGMYMLRITTSNGSVETRKVVVIR